MTNEPVERVPTGQAPVASRTEPAPLEVDMVRVVGIGTAAWAVALVTLFPFWGWLDRTQRLHWLLTCAAGVALGLLGLWICLRRARRESTARD